MNNEHRTYEPPRIDRIPLEPATFAGFYKIVWPRPTHPAP